MLGIAHDEVCGRTRDRRVSSRATDLPLKRNTLPQHNAARRLFCERAHELADRAEILGQEVSVELAPIAERLRRLAQRLAAPAKVTPPAATLAAALPVAHSPALAKPAPQDSAKGVDGIERVRGERLILAFEAKRCIHARHCVLNGPDVFAANVQGPWIHPDAASSDTVVSIAQLCPSGAITYERTDGEPNERVPLVNATLCRCGALLCRCGGSSNKPFCDGTHARIGFVADS